MMVLASLFLWPSPAQLHLWSNNPRFFQPNRRRPTTLVWSQQGSSHLQHGCLLSMQSQNVEIKHAPLKKKQKLSIGDSNSNANPPVSRAALQEKIAQLLSNAQKLRPGTSHYPARYSLGIDFGDARTGVAISKGFAPRPVAVVELRGPKLEARLLQLADEEMAEEFVVGLPKSSTGSETQQSSKVRCFAGRLAARAAERGWRVYLHDEFGTSEEALDYMIMMGSTKKGRRTQVDAYAAVMLLRSYFDSAGRHAELVVPKNMSLQQRLCDGPILSFSDDEFHEIQDQVLVDVQFSYEMFGQVAAN